MELRGFSKNFGRMLSPNLLKHLDLSIGLLAYDYTLALHHVHLNLPRPKAPKNMLASSN